MQCCRIAAWLSCVIVVAAFSRNAVASVVVDFDYTGAQQSIVVPVDVYSITIRTWGAQGQTNAGGFSGGVPGGLGGFSTGGLAVVPGKTLYIYVGGGGTMSVSGGFNGGGDAGPGGTVAGARGGGGGPRTFV